VKHQAVSFCLIISAALTLAALSRAADKPDNHTNKDQQALAIGHAVLKLNEIGKAGAPLMTDDHKNELEQTVRFLSGTPANRMTWAWLAFRIRNDSQLTIENNPGAEAIKQRLDLYQKLLRKYFIFE
jgi:hypothetical protein